MAAEELHFDAKTFSGQVRLFPLPNLVLFPHVLQPLHIFEPRYRELFEEALAGDRLIAMAVLAPGWEQNYEGRPALEPTACLGRIVTHQRLEDGRYNLLLAGLRRLRIVRELPPHKAFREARAEIIEDCYGSEPAAERPRLQRSLLEQFRRVLPNMPEVHQQLEELLCTDVSLGMLTDLIAYALTIPPSTKAALLAEANVDRRCTELLRLLAEGIRSDEASTPSKVATTKFPEKWPPDFSRN